MLTPSHHDVSLGPFVGADELRFAVEGDAGMLVGAATTHARVIRIVTHLRGRVVEAGHERLVVSHFGVQVTLRYHVPHPITLEWLSDREVSIDVTHATEDGSGTTLQSLVVRDLHGGNVLVSASDGEDHEPGGLDLAVRSLPDRQPGRPRVAFTTTRDSVVVPVGQYAFVECDGRRFRAHAIRGGRRPAFLVQSVEG